MVTVFIYSIVVVETNIIKENIHLGALLLLSTLNINQVPHTHKNFRILCT